MEERKYKTIFIGTGEFAVAPLKKLLELPFIELLGVITQPDKPAGRKMVLQPSPVKKFFLTLSHSSSIRILQPEHILEIKNSDFIINKDMDLFIVASYGQIIPDDILKIPKFPALNLHGSLLPVLRGAVPVNKAILEGLSETGVTLQIMSSKMDAGDIISQKKVELKGTERTPELMATLSQKAAEILQEDLLKFLEGKLTPVAQDSFKATFCFKTDIEKEKSEVKFDTSVTTAERMVRALLNWPVARIKLKDGKILKIYNAEIEKSNSTNTDFKIYRAGSKLLLDLFDGTLNLLEVQLEGKRKDVAKNYYFLDGML